jgi:hypothetical protein
MEGVGHKRERVYGISGDEFDEEEYGVDGEEDEDAVRFGERHLVWFGEDGAVGYRASSATRLRCALG